MTYINLLPGVPKVESPLFGRLFEDADAETLRIARSLHQDGFAVVDFPDPDFGPLAETVIAKLGPQMPLERSGQGKAPVHALREPGRPCRRCVGLRRTLSS
jgi:hypothetical protein